jgi:MinD superfamily P-loop ATPase
MKIAIASGKGGTGKTSLATNLSAFIADKEKIVLADLDVEEPNSGLFIKSELISEKIQYKQVPQWKQDTCTLCNLCQQNCNFNAIIQLGAQIMVFPQLCHSCYACSELCPTNSLPMNPKRIGTVTKYKSGNILFYESRLDIGQEQAVPLIAKTNKIIDAVDQVSIKIFDAPPGTSCPVIEATKDADFVILVTEPTPFGLNDLQLAAETMEEMNKKYGVVINRYNSSYSKIEEYCSNENIPIITTIPNMREIASHYSRGELFYHIPEVRKAMEEIYEFITSKVLAV